MVFQLADLLGSDDDAGDKRFVQLPSEGDLRNRGVSTLSHFMHHVDNVIGALEVNRREGELAASCISIWRIRARDLPGQQTTSQRAPGQQADFLIFEQRSDFALDIASGDRIISL